MCISCVGSELSPAPGSIYKSDTARKLSDDSTLWDAEGKQYKNLKDEWYDIIVLLITLALPVGNSRELSFNSKVLLCLDPICH